MTKSLTILACFLALTAIAFSQSTKRNARPSNPQPAATPPATTPEPTPSPTTKRNERPQGGSGTTNISKIAVDKPSYLYEFAQPDFIVSYVRIEHDENGRGRIYFKKKGLEEPVSDPISLSAATLERIKAALTALNFLDSTEDYQYSRDYSHMGNISITYRKDGRERTAKYNWTENKDAKALMDEYRKIGIQYVWQFDMVVSRENQPLNAPGLMDELDSYLRRNEISDPTQMLPLLKQLSNDERIPLIARNHAVKLAEKIEKAKN